MSSNEIGINSASARTLRSGTAINVAFAAACCLAMAGAPLEGWAAAKFYRPGSAAVTVENNVRVFRVGRPGVAPAERSTPPKQAETARSEKAAPAGQAKTARAEPPTHAALDLKAPTPDLIRAAAVQIGERYDAVLQATWERHGADIRAAAARHGVPEDLILGVIAVESGGRHDAVSPKGARGLMQLMPATAASLGVVDPLDTDQNIGGGTALLSTLSRRYQGNPVLMLAAYNAGEGAVNRHGGVPPYAETIDYIPRVLGAAAAARRLVQTSL